MPAEPLLEIRDLEVEYRMPGGGAVVRVVREASLVVAKGSCVGLVGESGCGKTTVANAITGIVKPAGGSIMFEGADVHAPGRRGRALLPRKIQMVFQDPFASLNPRLTVGAAIAEVLKVHGLAAKGVARASRVLELLVGVGLDPLHAGRYPHELSGGQRQRVGIARALAVQPVMLVADEPVSALDVSVQVQVLNLLKRIQRESDITLLFIAHDLGTVRYMCDRVAVMYLGRIVESADANALFTCPSHPYSEALLSAVPTLEKAGRGGCRPRRIILKGGVPSSLARIDGCAFHPRCHRAQDVCATTPPPWRQVGGGHFSACHFAQQLHDRPLDFLSVR